MTGYEGTSADRRGRSANHELGQTTESPNRDAIGSLLNRLDIVDPAYKGGATVPAQDDAAEILERMKQEAEQTRRNKNAKEQG